MESNNLILNRIFTKNTLNDLLMNQESIVLTNSVKRYLNDVEDLKNNEIISAIYKFMLKSYKNEYVYKNTLLNKLLLGVHSLNTTTALTEVSIERSKADFILINGKATVYEIKTELDTLDRLNGQIEDYYKAFPNVCVITNENDCKKVEDTIANKNVGIYVLTKRNTISPKRKPIEHYDSLQKESMFKVLRKPEYELILKDQFNELPKVRQVEYYKACLEKFKSIDVLKSYELVIRELKKRNRIEIEDFKDKVPHELKFLVYFSEFKKMDYLLLEEFLNEKYRG